MGWEVLALGRFFSLDFEFYGVLDDRKGMAFE